MKQHRMEQHRVVSAGLPGSVSGRTAGAPACVPTGGLRLTMRGRLLSALLLSLLPVLAFSAGRASAGDAAAVTAASSPAHVQIRVAPGDTLWSIAARVRHGGDPRDVIAQIHRLNALSDGRLDAGQALLVPAGPAS